MMVTHTPTRTSDWSTPMERRPPQPTTKGSSDWFTGDVYVDAVARSGGTRR
jgi:hypothetical protein